MKKTYINPTTDIVLVNTGCQICIGSPGDKPTKGLDDDNIEDGGNNPGDFSRRRRRNQWEDEEEEEEQW